MRSYRLLKKSKPFDRLYKKNFGVSPEKAFAALCLRNFDVSKKDIDAYASDIGHILSIVLSMWTPPQRDELAVRAFWRGLQLCDNRKQLYAVFKREATDQTLADALDLCRDGFRRRTTGSSLPSTKLSSPISRKRSFVEWWRRFAALAKAYDWPIEEQAKKLPGLVTGRAF